MSSNFDATVQAGIAAFKAWQTEGQRAYVDRFVATSLTQKGEKILWTLDRSSPEHEVENVVRRAVKAGY